MIEPDELESLKAKIAILEEENLTLSQSSEELLLINTLFDTIKENQSLVSLYQSVLEKVAILKDIPFCSFLRKNSDSLTLIASYALFKSDVKEVTQLKLEDSDLKKIDYEPLSIVKENISAVKQQLFISDTDCVCTEIMLVPFKSLLTGACVFLLIDDDLSEDRLSKMLSYLSYVINRIVERFDIIYYQDVLQKLNHELEEKVLERTHELLELNKQLKKEIEERKKSQDSLSINEKRFRKLFEESINAIFLVDKTNGRYIDANKAAEKLTGRSLDELKKLDVLSVTPDGARERLNKISKYKEQYLGEVTYVRPDGSNRIAILSIVHLDNDTAYGIANDITENKKYEDLVKKSEASLSALINNKTESIWSIDKDYNYIVFNDFFSNSYFETFHQRIESGMNALKILSQELKDFWKPRYDAALKGERISFEFPILTNSQTKYFNVFLNPIVIDKNITGVSALSIDVTQQKLSEKTLFENQLHLSFLVNNSPIILFAIDQKGIFTLSEGRGLAALGLKPGEVVGLSSFEFYKDFPQVVKAIRNSLNGESQSLIQDMGKWVFDVSYTPTKNNNGETTGVIGVATDITARWLAEKEISGLWNILNESLNEIYVFDAETFVFQYVNEGAKKNLGYSSEEMYSLTPLAIKPEFTISSFKELAKPLLENQKEKIVFETIHKRSDGSTYPVEIHLQLVQLDGRQKFLAIINDITERKRIKDDLLNRTRELSTLLKSNQKLSATLDLETVLQITTDNIIELMDLQSAAIYLLEGDVLYLGATSPALPPQFPEHLRRSLLTDHPHINKAVKNSQTIFLPDTSIAELTTNERAVVNQRGLRSILYLPLIVHSTVIGVLIVATIDEIREFTTQETDLCQALASISSIALENSRLYSQAQQEIAHRKKTEEALIQAKEKAEEMVKLKSYFFANMSHELRTPFVGILGFAEILKDTLNNPEEREYAEQILKSSKRLTDTLNKILNLSRIEFDKVEVKNTLVDVCELLRNLESFYSTSAKLNNTTISACAVDNNLKVFTDPKLLEDILINLVSNAIKFTENGSISLSASQALEKGSQRLLITVKDTGIGIPEGKQNLVWQEFRQASEGFNRSFEGTGLGLTITKRYVELLGGTITLNSAENKGTCFTIRLPMAHTTVENLNEKKEIKFIKNSYVKRQLIVKSKILYVEDDAVALQFISLILKSSYEVETAFSAIAALELVARKDYDVVMLDINLGRGMDGVELMQKIRQIDHYKNIPIVAVTAYAAAADKSDFLNKGFTHYISKPFVKNQLLHLLSHIN